MSSRRVFVANLSKFVTKEDLDNEFGRCGTIVKSNLVFDPQTGKSKGYAFVDFATPAEAGVAIQALNGHTLKGRVIEVSYAKAKV